MSEEARNPSESFTETVMRAMKESGDSGDRVVLIVLHSDGITSQVFSNTRSEAEMNGLLWQALNCQIDVSGG